MKKKLLAGLATGLFMFGTVGMANASLTTIGTAQFGGTGTEYNLIWDNDNNGNSVVWLDYSSAQTNWATQNAWAAGLDAVLSISLDGYRVDWDDNSWRLPATADGTSNYQNDVNNPAYYSITSSELGHLYYEELGNLGRFDANGISQSGFGLQNTGDFNNIIDFWYWSGTEYASNTANAWMFYTGDGRQISYGKGYDVVYGLALRNGQVTATPIPGAAWLLCSGLAGLVGLKRKKKA